MSMSILNRFLHAAMALVHDIVEDTSDADGVLRNAYFSFDAEDTGSTSEDETSAESLDDSDDEYVTESEDELTFEDTNESADEQPSVSWPNVGAGRATAPVATQPSWPNVGSGRAATAVAVAPQPARQATAVADDGVLRVTVGRDQRGRACVPAALTSQIGLRPGRPIYVAQRAHGLPGLVLLRRAPKTGRLGKYTVDSHGNVRLSNGILGRASLGNVQQIRFRVTDTNDGIVAVAG